MPDPLPGGGFSRSALNAVAGTPYESPNRQLGSPKFQASVKACMSEAIASGFVHTPAEIAQHDRQLLAEDECIPKHGVPDMPGPTDQGAQPFPPGITPSSSLFQKAQNHCAYLNP